MEKFCSNCGKEVSEGAAFCDGCGNALNGTKANQTSIPKTALLSNAGSVGVYEFLETLEPNLDFIWARSGNDVKAQLLGIGAAFIVDTYILAFNLQNLYICQLSKMSGKEIVNINKYAWSDIKSFTASRAAVGKTLKFTTKHGNLSFRTQKLFSMENQGDRIEKLLALQK